jgi:hypothetical protein
VQRARYALADRSRPILERSGQNGLFFRHDVAVDFDQVVEVCYSDAVLCIADALCKGI